MYGLPKFSSVQTMFWNKPRSPKPASIRTPAPENWDYFVAAAKKLTTDDHYGYACDLGNAAGAYQNFLRMLLLNGGEMYDADYQPIFNSEAGVEALTRLVELLRLHKVMDPSSLQISHSSDLADLFARGDVATVFNWPFQWAVATGEKSSLDAAAVGNGLIPGISVRSATIDGAEGLAINKFSKNKEAALAFLQFVASSEVQREIVAKEGWFPVSESVLTDAASVKALPVLTTYQESTKYASKRYGTPWSSELDQLLSVQLNQAMNAKITAQGGLDAAVTGTLELVTKYLPR